MRNLKGRRIAILATNGFEESELFEPKRILENSGAEVTVISPVSGKIKAWRHGNWSKEIKVDVTLENASEKDYDCLILPGGVLNPDKLRRSSEAVDLVRRFFEKKKLIAAICHGPQLLIDAEIINGRTMTSFHAIRKDLQNAGAMISSGSNNCIYFGNICNNRDFSQQEVWDTCNHYCHYLHRYFFISYAAS